MVADLIVVAVLAIVARLILTPVCPRCGAVRRQQRLALTSRHRCGRCWSTYAERDG